MKKVYINQIEKMLNDNELKGKELLRRFLWRNTIKAKFKENDKVIFSEKNRYIYGKQVIDYIGTIIKINYWYGSAIEKPFISYEIQFFVNNESFNAFIEEKKLKKTKSKKLNNIVVKKDKERDAFYI